MINAQRTFDGRLIDREGKVTRLYHYTGKPWEFTQYHHYKQDADSVWFKPAGLWLSVEDDWERWCRGEDFNICGLAYKTELILAPNANILHLEYEDDIDRFTHKYMDHLHRNRMPGYINWAPVIKDYAGIIIAPYCWERRLTPHTMWYYTWDCASACIWDLSCVSPVLVDPV